MKRIGKEMFCICDFCGHDEADDIGHVMPLGDKGICERCARALAAILFPWIARLEEKAKEVRR